MSHLLAPSLLSCNFGKLNEEVEFINNSQADWFHIDVMDGVFVPNISFGFPILQSIQKVAKKPLDVHLMIVNPDNYISQFAELGANYISVHYEACTHLHRTLQLIEKNGCKKGIAYNPHTPTTNLFDILYYTDLVCMMSVNPGFGAQSFIEHTFKKIEELANFKAKNGLSFLIEIDGGVSTKNAKALINAGANVLVAGNSVFKAANQTLAIEELKSLK